GYTDRAVGSRRAPSAGGLYPTEVYVFARERSTPRALYLSFREHAFYLVDGADGTGLLEAMQCDADDVAVVLASVLWRTGQRYGVRGYRYCLLDAGTIAYNMGEVVAALEAPFSIHPVAPSMHIERMLSFPYGEVCALALRIAGPTVRALRELRAPSVARGLP